MLYSINPSTYSKPYKRWNALPYFAEKYGFRFNWRSSFSKALRIMKDINH